MLNLYQEMLNEQKAIESSALNELLDRPLINPFSISTVNRSRHMKMVCPL